MEPSCEEAHSDGRRVRATRDHVLDEATAVRLAETFKALSDPTRVRIISALLTDELCVHELAESVGVSPSAASHQLALLRKMRLVRSTREGRRIFYTLDDDHIRGLFRQGLDHALHD